MSIGRSDKIWYKFISELIKFNKEHNHCNVPKVYEKNRWLGGKVSHVRQAYRKGTLSSTQIKKLEELGFEWILKKSSEDSWHQFIDELSEYKNKFGDCNVPSTYEDKWFAYKVGTERKNYKKGLLAKERINQLNDLDFVWNPKEIELKESWTKFIEKLTAYKNEFGNCNVPFTFYDRWLVIKVAGVRQNYKNNILSLNQINQLDRMGFNWESQYNNPKIYWKKTIQVLKKYFKVHGHCNISESHSLEYSQKLVKFRQKYKNGKLSDSQIKQLESLGIVWEHAINTSNKSWGIFIDKLVAFKKEFSHCNVPRAYKDKWLVNKVGNTRYRYSKGILSDEQIKQLEELGFEWNTLDESWNKFINELIAFKKEFGHCDVSGNYRDKWLAVKVSSVRQSNKKHLLDSNRAKELNNLGFVWNPKEIELKESWSLFIQKLIIYKNVFGHCNVPSAFIDKWLANKVSNVRNNYRINKLKKKQISQLEKLGFVWNILDESWNIFIDKLTEFKDEFLHCNVPISYHDKWLAKKVGTCRGDYKNGKLSEDKINQLESLGIIWNLKEINRELSWERFINELKIYKNTYGDVEVKIENNKYLYYKLSGIRKEYNEHSLSLSKIQELTKIGIIFNKKELEWKEFINRLTNYKNLYGNCKVSPKIDYELNYKLKFTRSQFNKGRLSKNQIYQLNTLGIIWRVRENSWEKFIKKLIKFREIEGHCNVPVNYEDKWLAGKLNKAKTDHKNSRLGHYKVIQLERLGVKWRIDTFRGRAFP